jgi:glucose/arabinose dehydrogenase
MPRAWLLVPLLLAAACGGGGGSETAPATTSPLSAAAGGIALRPLVSGLAQPVDVVGVPGTGDLAIVEKTGRVRIWHDGGLQPRPVLDLTGRLSQSSEQGLLSIAFSPHYREDGLAYVDYTDPGGDTHVGELNTRTGALRTILFVHQPYPNHNGGALAFGPDGRLYVGMGDGGSEGDPEGNGQNPHALLGKILRLDVARPGSPPEIYALGLRNPWRFSFDSATGDLWIGDVGQNRYEEVDRLSRGTAAGANLGWNLMEGNVRYDEDRSLPASLIAPVAVYSHAHGCSITGGFVYRGRDLPQLRGRYVFGDFCSGTIWSMPASGGRFARLDVPAVPQLSSFGVDTSGELYAVSLTGLVLKFVRGS